jgi:replicative DNA helicase Mcm
MSPIVDGPSVDDLVTFLRTYYHEDVGELAQHYPKEQTTLSVSFNDLRAAHPDFARRYLDEPEVVRERLLEALRLYDIPIDISFDRARIRVHDLPNEEVHDVGVPMVSEIEDRVQGIRGQVTKQTQKQRIVTTAVFVCQRCGTETTVPQTGYTLHQPHECVGCDRQGPFDTDLSASEKANHQLIRIQTPPEASDDGSTDEMEITLLDDLVGNVSVGDRIVANSLIELEQESDDSTLFDPIGHAESIDRIDTDYEDLSIREHLDRIREIAESGNAVQQIVDSIVPSHEGDHDVKEAIALQLFGGVNKELQDGSQKRGTIHVLLMGDPGCGKSALLRYVNHLAPRSVFATGKGSSSAGLTAAAVQDDFGSGGWTLEAGALVKANGGLCLIDELDDMAAEDQAGLLEALADQEISVNKAGINATLPADTTVLAAANPIHGRFSPHEAIAQQFDLDSTLQSRFDLIFAMKDTVDENRDGRIVNTILDSAEAGQRNERGEEIGNPEIEPEIEPEVLRAYIAHAKTITPVIDEEAKETIREQYLSLRQANDDNGPIPVTPRASEALIRLAEASARIRLSEEITAEDAARAARLHQSCLEDVGIDPETGEFDVDIVETGESMSQRKRMQTVVEAIQGLEDEEEFTHGAPYEEVVSFMGDFDVSREKVDHALDKLLEQASVYRPQNGETTTYRTT